MPSHIVKHRGVRRTRVALLATVAVLGCVPPRPASAQVFEVVGTRAQGMGGAFVAVADDATAVYWNPAGLGTGAMVDFQLEMGRRERTAGAGSRSKLRGLALGVPSLGLSYWHLQTATAIPPGLTTVSGLGDRQDEGSGEVQLQVLETTNLGMTVLQTIANGVVVGSTLRVVRGHAARGSAAAGARIEDLLVEAEGLSAASARTRFDVDTGVMVSMGAVRVGLTARNLRQPEFPVADGFEPVSLKRQVRLGVALAPRSRPTGIHGPFTVAVDLDLTKSQELLGSTSSGQPESAEGRRNVAMGGERWWAGGWLGTRAGVRFSTIGDRRLVGAAGLTIGLRRSMFVEGQMTKGELKSDKSWNISTRMTF